MLATTALLDSNALARRARRSSRRCAATSAAARATSKILDAVEDLAPLASREVRGEGRRRPAAPLRRARRTSRARRMYVDDVRVPGMLWCKGLRSPHESARIVQHRHLEGREAARRARRRAARGHAHEHRRPPGGARRAGRRAVPRRSTRCATAASSSAASRPRTRPPRRRRSSLIEVEYEEREPFLDVRQALRRRAGRRSRPTGNVFFYDPYYSRQVRKGDIDVGLRARRRDRAGRLPPRRRSSRRRPRRRSRWCIPQPDGRIVVYSCTQAMYFSMGVLAQHLNMPHEPLQVRRRHRRRRLRRQGRHGHGAARGAARAQDEPRRSSGASRARRSSSAARCAPSWHVEMADAVTEDGWLLGRKVLTLHDAGAYTRFSSATARPSTRSTSAAPTPCRTCTPTPTSSGRTTCRRTAMRGFGVTSRVVRDRDADVARGGRAGHRPVGVPAQEREPHRRRRALPRGARRPLDGADDPGGRRRGRQGALGRVPRR